MGDYSININLNTTSATGGFQGILDALNNINNAVANVNSSIQNMGGGGGGGNNPTNRATRSLADMGVAYNKLASTIKSTKNDLKAELEQLEKLRNARVQDANAIAQSEARLRGLESRLTQLTSAQRLYNRTLGDTSKQANVTSRALGGLHTTFNKLGAVLGISFGLYGVFRAMQFGIKTIAEFDLAMGKLRSILGESKAGMDDIKKSAIDVGKNSIFGAKGVAELQIELAKMGFAKSEIMAMQQAIVNLATATQEDLSGSAEVVANVIRSFQLSASDATMVVDVMGKAFNDSALDLANFREAIKYVAPIAKQAGFSFQETTAMLEQLSNAGIKGSLAGTGLTNIISRLGNENSKFVKTVGHTVTGMDEFIASLIDLKKRGIDLGGVFELVDRRAAATFSILLEGVDSVEQFRKKLMESSGVMKDQTAVQLDTISYRADLARESWKSFILELDSGDNVISNLTKSFLTFFTNLTRFTTIQGNITDTADSISRLSTTIRRLMEEGIGKEGMTVIDKQKLDSDLSAAREYYQVLVELNDKYVKKYMEANSLPVGMREIVISKLKSQQIADMDELQKKFGNVTDNLTSSLNRVIENGAKPYFEGFKKYVSEVGIEKAFEIEYKAINTLQRTFAKDPEKMQIYAKALGMINDEYKKLKGFEAPKAGDADKEAIKKQIELLNLQKKLQEELIRSRYSGATESMMLAQNEYEFGLKILEAEKKSKEQTDIEKRTLTAKYYNDIIKLAEGAGKELDKIDEKRVKAAEKYLEEQAKKAEDILMGRMKRQEDVNKDLVKSVQEGNFKNDPKSEISSWIDLLQSPLLIEGENNWERFKESIDMVKDSLTSLVDSWVTSTTRIVDERNRMVDEAQSALDTELELQKQGYASNVSLKRKELEEQKKLRAEAIEQQRKAQRIQLALDSAQQFSSLATASAKYFDAGATFGLPGVALAIAAISLMFATFAKFKNLAKEQSAVKYEKGGWIGGRRHSQGGTDINAEVDEFVVKRSSALKYGSLLESINNDDQVSVNRFLLNNLKGSFLNARVSLDDSEDLKAIRRALENNGKSVEYGNGYRIERYGNITTKIYTN